MHRPLNRRNDMNRIRRTLKQGLLNLGFARACHNYNDVSSILNDIQAQALLIQNTDIQIITDNVQTLIKTTRSQTPIFDETRLDTLIYLLQKAISEI
jgi:GT2 family glycosyltransferase